jgi:hypothetical protein
MIIILVWLNLYTYKINLIFIFLKKIIEYKPNVCIVLESESATHGVPYSDCFTVRNRFCITRVTSNSTRLCVTSFLNYVQKPNFIAKGIKLFVYHSKIN